MVNTVLRNLLSNAMKFTPSGGTIDVSAQPHDEQFLEVAVADTGIGIREEDLSKLFRIDVQYINVGTAATNVFLMDVASDFFTENSLNITSDEGSTTDYIPVQGIPHGKGADIASANDMAKPKQQIKATRQ